MPPHILLFGAGKSATCLIDFLLRESGIQWRLTIADSNLPLAQAKGRGLANAVAVNVQDDAARNQLIQSADVVISMLPPALHILVAKDCLAFEKHLLTASY